MVRFWQYPYENSESIDAEGYEPVTAFESDHERALLRRADGLGLTTVQAPAAQSATLRIQQEGFETWREQLFERYERIVIW